MEVLEIAKVDMFSKNDVVLPVEMRENYLCVVWEGTLIERPIEVARKSISSLLRGDDSDILNSTPAVWHAGDWTGPISLQPNRRLSSESGVNSALSDIVAASDAGVKVNASYCLLTYRKFLILFCR